MSFSQIDVNRRTKKPHFLFQINQLLHWEEIEQQINHYYRPNSAIVGRTPYQGILLFKMLLVGIWYGGLSDEMVEEKACSDLYVMRFLGLALEDNVPDHSTLSRFRTHLSTINAWDNILNNINQQISDYGLLIKSGVSVDASVTTSQRKPKRKTTYEVKQDRDEKSDEPQAAQYMEVVKINETGVDTEARFTKKGGKTLFGYKQHTAVDAQGLILSIVTTSANQHDSLAFEEVLNKAALPQQTRIYADKAYSSKKHSAYLKDLGFKNGIQNKAVKNKPLTSRQHRRNKLITQSRYVVERTFGSQTRWFGSKILRYLGLDKAHAWHVLLAISYNLKRLPNLMMKELQRSCV